MRLGILAKISRAKWGLETGIPQFTNDPIITSLLRYGTTLFGSCMPPDQVSRIDTCVINVASHRITGLDRTTRIETLRFLAATSSYHNRYTLHCAGMIDAILRAEGCEAQWRLRGEIGQLLEVKSLEENTWEQAIAIPSTLLQGEAGKQAEWAATQWTVRRYRKHPV